MSRSGRNASPGWQSPPPGRPRSWRARSVRDTSTTLRVVVAGFSGAAVALLLVGVVPDGGPTAGSRPAPASVPPSFAPAGTDPGPALALLETIPVKGRAPRTGYEREQFGQRWADTDRNGCDTRNDILGRDLTGEKFKPGTRDCLVLTGLLDDPYTGRAIPFTRQDASAVQIDHVVALSDAWQKGAQAWPPAQRLAFANDPLNLLAVDGPTNARKSDGDAATWLPPHKAFRCPMVARQVAVKAKYGLWVVPPERDAMARVLRQCPGEPVPSSDAPTSAPTG